MEASRLSRGARRGRVVALALLVAIIGIGVWARAALWDHFKAAVYDRRIRAGVNPEGNLEALARLSPAVAVGSLERHVRASMGWSERAEKILYWSFPESTVAGAMREYEGIVGYKYFNWYSSSHLRYADFLPHDARDGLRSWLARHRDHPGRDDVCLRLAAELERDEPIEALRLLIQGFHAPDGDKRGEISYWFHRVLERFASSADLLAWLEGGCPAEVRDTLTYVLAVKLLREHRYDEAVSFFERSIPFVEAAALRSDWGEQCGMSRLAAGDLGKQLEGARWLAGKAREVAAAADPEARAACLHAMGRKAFHEQGIFRNRFHPLLAREGDPGPRDPLPTGSPRLKSEHAVDDIGLGLSYRQAAGYFRRIAEEHPSYSRIEEVEYSIPLSLWRLRAEGAGWWQGSRLELDRAIHEGFQRFAERYPRSSMADEALYSAGLSHWEASHRTDTSVLMADMLRIVEEHPGGNVIREHGTTNRWLRAAIARKDLEDAIAGAAESVPCLLRSFAAAANGWFLEGAGSRR
jgi:hypothetical protein